MNIMEQHLPLVIVLVRIIGFGIFFDFWIRFRQWRYSLICTGWFLYSISSLPIVLFPLSDPVFILYGILSCSGLGILMAMVFHYIELPRLWRFGVISAGAVVSGIIVTNVHPLFDSYDFISLSHLIIYLNSFVLTLLHYKDFRRSTANHVVIFLVVGFFGMIQTMGGMVFVSDRFLLASFPVSVALTVLLLVLFILTENQLAQGKLMRSNLRFGSLVRALPMGVTEHDMEGKIIFVNPAMEHILGFAPDELVGKYLWDLQVDEKARQASRQYLKMLLKELPEPVSYFGKNRTKNGDIIDVRVDWDYRRDESGKVTGFIAATTDITEELLLQEKTRQDEAIKRSIIESPTSINIWAVDREYRYVFFNEAHAKAMKGYWKKDIRLGKNILDYISDERYREEVQHHYDYVMEGNTYTDIDRFEHEGGEDSYFHNIVSPVYDTEGSIIGLTVFTHEITDRVKAEKELKSSLEEKEVLLKEVHHRVKNNLQIITSLLSLQQSRLDPERAPVIFQECQNRITSMTLIHELLYKSENLASLDMRYYFQRLINHILDSYEIVTTMFDVTLDVEDVSLDLEPTISLGLLMNEFVSNTIKHAFTDVTRERKEIYLSLKREENSTLVLTYRDNGRGVPDSFSPDKQSTLGLKLVSSIVKRYRGTIEISGQNGMSIAVTLPQDEESAKNGDSG